jgi:hypothetical protein
MDVLFILLILALILTWIIVFLISRKIVQGLGAKKRRQSHELEQEFTPRNPAVPLPPRMPRVPPSSPNQYFSTASKSTYWGEMVNLNSLCTKSGKRVADCNCRVCENLKGRA